MLGQQLAIPTRATTQAGEIAIGVSPPDCREDTLCEGGLGSTGTATSACSWVLLSPTLGPPIPTAVEGAGGGGREGWDLFLTRTPSCFVYFCNLKKLLLCLLARRET